MSKNSEISERTSEEIVGETLPADILEKYDTEQQVQLNSAFKILHVLLNYESSEPFVEEPKNEILGSKHYNDVIENTMWLSEIKRKFLSTEYHSLIEVVMDIRLILENCYYFWGPKVPLTEQCILMERQFEKQLSLLPKELKNLCTLDKTHGPSSDTVNKMWNRCKNKGKNCTILMLRTWKRRRQNESEIYQQKSDISSLCSFSEQLKKWEDDTLLLPNDYCSKFSMPELLEIGLIFRLVREQFEIEPFCQREIELMFLMTQYSSLFQKILSVLLNVDGNDTTDTISNYDDLLLKLKEKVSQWYDVSETNDDDSTKLKDSQTSNVGLNFFESVGRRNPFATQKFELFPFHQKVVIIKTLCDEWLQTRSNISELILKTKEEDSLIEKLGQDKYGYVYVYCRRFEDFRIYKFKFKDELISQNSAAENDQHIVLNEILSEYLSCEKVRITECELVADSFDKMRSLIDIFFKAELESSKKNNMVLQSSLLEALLKLDAELYSKDDKFIRLTNECRIKLYNEWHAKNKCNNSESTDFISVCKDIEEEELMKMDENDIEKVKDTIRETENTVSDDSYCETNDKDDTDCEESEQDTENSSSSSKNSCNLKRKIRWKYRNNRNEEEHVRSKHSFSDAFHFSTNELITDDDNTESAPSMDVDMKNNKNQEMSNKDDSSEPVSNRRRRNSVPSYRMYKNDMFSDEDYSAEETYSSEEDSDDDWVIPRKRTKNKKNKSNKYLKTSTRNESGFKRGSLSTANNTKTMSFIKEEPLNYDPNMIIKVEDIKTEKFEVFEKSNEVKVKEEKTCNQKIKVMDFAKLSTTRNLRPILPKADIPPTQVPVQVLPVNKGSILGTQKVHHHQVRSIQQPVVRNIQQPVIRNAYILASPNPRMSRVSNPRQMIARLMSARRMVSPLQVTVQPRIVRAQSINPAFSNQEATFKHAPLYKQLICAPIKQQNKVTNLNAIAALRTKPFVRSKTPQNNIPMRKINRNMLFAPKPILPKPEVREIEGTIGIHSNTDDSLQYVVNLANGSHVPLSDEQVQKLREQNRGVLPMKLKIPVPIDVAEKIEPCVVIED